MKGKICREIYKSSEKAALHFSLIDPDPEKTKNLEEVVKKLTKWGTDAVMVGGSTLSDKSYLDSVVKKIKQNTDKPVILFPGDANGISRYADAVFFMSLLNSKDPYWISGIQSRGAFFVKEADIEVIPMAYVIIEPGMKAGEVGKADLIKRDDSEKAARYALAAQYFGMSLVYLEAGSGADKPVPVEMVKKVRQSLEIPLIVGGGIRSASAAEERVRAGADIIVTGTIIERDANKVREIIEAVKSVKR